MISSKRERWPSFLVISVPEHWLTRRYWKSRFQQSRFNHPQLRRDWNIVSISTSRGNDLNDEETENPWKFMKWYFRYDAQGTIMQVTAGNRSNSLPGWRFWRKKRAPVITGFFSSATIQPTSSKKRRPICEIKQGQWLPTRRHNFFKTFIFLTYKWIWKNFNLIVTLVLTSQQYYLYFALYFGGLRRRTLPRPPQPR